MSRINPTGVRRPAFSRLHIAAGGTIPAAFAEHRVLTAMFRGLFFVIAHTDDRERAAQAATDLTTRHEGHRDVYVVLFTDAHLDALAAGVELHLTVLDDHLRTDDHRTPIRVTNTSTVTLTTEHGPFLGEITTTRDLHTGDVYTCGVPRLGSGNPGLAVYRARADYDPTTGEVRHHLVDPGWTPAPDERTGALTDGPDCLVHRIIDRTAILTQLNLTDLAPVHA
jgi:hypothetical protein